MLALFYGIITTKEALLGKHSIPARAEDRFKCKRCMLAKDVYIHNC